MYSQCGPIPELGMGMQFLGILPAGTGSDWECDMCDMLCAAGQKSCVLFHHTLWQLWPSGQQCCPPLTPHMAPPPPHQKRVTNTPCPPYPPRATVMNIVTHNNAHSNTTRSTLAKVLDPKEKKRAFKDKKLLSLFMTMTSPCCLMLKMMSPNPNKGLKAEREGLNPKP